MGDAVCASAVALRADWACVAGDAVADLAGTLAVGEVPLATVIGIEVAISPPLIAAVEDALARVASDRRVGELGADRAAGTAAVDVRLEVAAGPIAAGFSLLALRRRLTAGGTLPVDTDLAVGAVAVVGARDTLVIGDVAVQSPVAVAVVVAAIGAGVVG